MVRFRAPCIISVCLLLLPSFHSCPILSPEPHTLPVESYPGDLDDNFCCKLMGGFRKSLTSKLDESTCPWICKTIIQIQALPRIHEWGAMGGEISAVFQHIGARPCPPSPWHPMIRLHHQPPNDSTSLLARVRFRCFSSHCIEFLRGYRCLFAVEQLKARRLKHDIVTGSLLQLLRSSLRVGQVTDPNTQITSN